METLVSWASAFTAALVIAVTVRCCLGELVRVKGNSMERTLRSGEVLLSLRPGKYRRGEVVLCQYPRRVERSAQLSAAVTVTQHSVFVKRLVALSGDSVEIFEGRLYVNDKPVLDPPQMGSAPRDMARLELGKNAYFVIGDNRRSSHDSRASDVGPLTADMLRGHVKAVLWPLNKIRKVI